jgi:hypothetical protein
VCAYVQSYVDAGTARNVLNLKMLRIIPIAAAAFVYLSILKIYYFLDYRHVLTIFNPSPNHLCPYIYYHIVFCAEVIVNPLGKCH